jgi:DNA-binding transcriptional ArsR family regulator
VLDLHKLQRVKKALLDLRSPLGRERLLLVRGQPSTERFRQRSSTTPGTPRSATVDVGAEWGILHQMAKYQEVRLSRTFSALADPTRRAILARLGQQPGASVTQLARDLPVKLPGVMKHLDVLTAAGLIERAKSGRVVAVHLAPGPLREATSWLQHYERFWSGSLDKLTRYLEEDVR